VRRDDDDRPAVVGEALFNRRGPNELVNGGCEFVGEGGELLPERGSLSPLLLVHKVASCRT